MKPLLFDAAASVAPSKRVLDVVNNISREYGSVHRGRGARSRYTSDLYEQARKIVIRHCNVPSTHTVVFTANTTDSLVKLSRTTYLQDSVVHTTAIEHSANVLPWLQAGHNIEFHNNHDDAVIAASIVLEDIVTLSGASNITGQIFHMPTYTRTSNPVIWDCSQRIAHAPCMIQPGVDAIVFSGHKIGAPFGAGVLIAPIEWLKDNPLCLGGGSVVDVDKNLVITQKSPPHNWESGTPNAIGAIALAEALDELNYNAIAYHDSLVNMWFERYIPIYPLWKCYGSTYMLPWNDVTEQLGNILPELEYRTGAFCCYKAFRNRLGEPNPGKHWGGLRLSAHSTVTEDDIMLIGESLKTLMR